MPLCDFEFGLLITSALKHCSFNSFVNLGFSHAKFRYFNLTFKYVDEELKCTEINDKTIGVCLDGSRYKAYGKLEGRQTTLGTFKTKEEAIKCRLEYERDYIGFNIAPQKHLFEQYGIVADSHD